MAEVSRRAHGGDEEATKGGTGGRVRVFSWTRRAHCASIFLAGARFAMVRRRIILRGGTVICV